MRYKFLKFKTVNKKYLTVVNMMCNCKDKIQIKYKTSDLQILVLKLKIYNFNLLQNFEVLKYLF